MTKARDLASGGFGLVLVKPSSVVNGTDNGKGTVSINAAGSVSLNNVFSSTYDNYFIVGKANGSTTANLVFRLRNAGSDLTGANYAYQQYGSGTSTNSSVTSIPITALNSTNYTGFVAFVTSPYLTEPKGFMANNGDKIGANNFLGYKWDGGIDVSTAYDGFSLIPSSGTFSGTISVYGYNK